MASQKVRKPNWSASEMESLVAEVGRRSSILFSSFSGAITMKRKRQGWEEITEKINSNSSTKRDWAEIKKKWTDMKCNSRKRSSTCKREMSKTGGGPPPEQLSSLDQMVISLIPSCQLDGCEGGLESEECVLPADASEQAAIASVPATPDEPPSLVPLSSPLEEMETESLIAEENSAAETSVKHATCAPVPSRPSVTVKPKGQILIIEEKKLEILQELLLTQRELLAVEKKRLSVEEEKVELLKNATSDNSLSPVIKFF